MNRTEALKMLEMLTPERAAYWSKAGKWTLAEAVALMHGFEPLEGWEENHEQKAHVMQVETAPLAGEIRRQSADPLPDTMPPREWIQHGLSAGNIHSMIVDAVMGKAHTDDGQSQIDSVFQFIRDNADDIYLRQYANHVRDPKCPKPSKASVARELQERFIAEGKIFKDGVIERYMRTMKWKAPKTD